jgi:hypothetical protein
MSVVPGTDAIPPEQGGQRRNAAWFVASASGSDGPAAGVSAGRRFLEAWSAKVDEWTRRLEPWLQPRSELDRILIEQIARAMTALERHHSLLRIASGWAMEQAATSWDRERRSLAAEVGARLAQDPERVVQTLEQTRHGVEYLLNLWRMLADTIEQTGGLNESQRSYFHDLLGVPHARRHGTTAVPAGNDRRGLLDLVSYQIMRLQARQEEYLNEFDRTERDIALQLVALLVDMTTREIQSRIASDMKRLRSALEEFEQFRSLPHGQPDPSKGGIKG